MALYIIYEDILFVFNVSDDFIKAFFTFTAEGTSIDQTMYIRRENKILVSKIVSVCIKIVDDCLMHIEADKICGYKRGHAAAGKSAEDGIDIVDAAAGTVFFCRKESAIDKLEADTVSEESRPIFHSHDRAAERIFQIVDDLLDALADESVLGKSAGQDAKNGKVTYVSLLGVKGAKARAEELNENCKNALLPYGERAEKLISLADELIKRVK